MKYAENMLKRYIKLYKGILADWLVFVVKINEMGAVIR